MPTDAYQTASGRVVMSLTQLDKKYSSSNVRISKWSSNEELLDTAFASGHIPFLLNKEMFSHLKEKLILMVALQTINLLSTKRQFVFLLMFGAIFKE